MTCARKDSDSKSLSKTLSDTYCITGEKPHQFDQCDRAFRHKGHLNTHYRLHMGERPYHCDKCNKSFIHKYRLNYHYRKHTGEKPYQCDQCDKAFIKISNMERHYSLHTGKKPHQSEKYDKYFTLRSLLNNDYWKHTGKKPHQCDVCQKALTHESSLNTHLAIHTGEKPYQFDRCDRAFRHKGTLNRLDSHSDRNLDRCEETIMRHEEKHVQVHTDQGIKLMKTSETKLTAPLMETKGTTKALNLEMCDESSIQTNLIAEKKPYQGVESKLRQTCPSQTFSQDLHPFGIRTVKIEESIHVCANCHVISDTEDSLTDHYQTCKEMKPAVKLETVCSHENNLMEDSVAQYSKENTDLVTDQKTTNLPDDDEQSAELSFLEDLFLVKGNSN